MNTTDNANFTVSTDDVIFAWLVTGYGTEAQKNDYIRILTQQIGMYDGAIL